MRACSSYAHRHSQVAELEAKVNELNETVAKLKAIAQPPKEKFFEHGHYTVEVDLLGLEVITSLGVSPNATPTLFKVFADFFGVVLPSRTRKVAGLNGSTVERTLIFVPGVTHFKELPAIGGELHKVQVAEWLLEDLDDGCFCYIADGANSRQKEIYAQLLSRRNKSTGKLESMAISMDEIIDKTSEGSASKYKLAMTAIAEAWEEADAAGLLSDVVNDNSVHQPHEEGNVDEAGGADDSLSSNGMLLSSAEQFFKQRRKELRTKLRRNIEQLRPTDAMNDRAAPQRKACRIVRGGDGSGGAGDVADNCTCAHHAVANVGEEGRKAMDGVLKKKMQITDEQAEADAAKVKALRTSVGWFSSPACSLIYQVSKYVALFSSKGYAIGENFAQWLAHKLKTSEAAAQQLIGNVEDLLAICGGRDYIFFLDAGVVDRFAQLESLYGYLLEEADLGAEAGGKLRKAIITGFESVYCMAAVRSMAIVADAWLWPMLRAIEPGDNVHILDVCPELWPRCCSWLEEAAANPQSAIDGTLCLRSSLEAAGLCVKPRIEPSTARRRRSMRAQLDLQRIRNAMITDTELKQLVHELLTVSFTAMAASVRNHAMEFMPGGRCCKANITEQMRKAMSGTPLTSVAAETMFARVKRRADRGGTPRHDTCAGAVLCDRDKTAQWARTKGHKTADGLWRQAVKRLHIGSGSRTMEAEREAKGAAKQPEREEKLARKRSGRAQKAAEVERLRTIEMASTYSTLKDMYNDELIDQLKVWKLIEKKSGFTVSGTRVELVMKLQSLIFERFGAAANDLPDGDAGTERGKVDGRRRHRSAAEGNKSRKGKRKRTSIVELHGWEWDNEEEFEIERLIGKMVSNGVTPVPGREGEKIPAGTVLYRVLWAGFPSEIATWEEEDQIPRGEVDFVGEYEDALAEEAEAEAEAEGADGGDEDPPGDVPGYM